MSDQPTVQRPSEQFLGELETHIVRVPHHRAGVAPGEHVNLEREADNRRDRHAIRVENGRFEPVGRLPRRLTAWLAPLIDAGYIRLEGYVPAAAGALSPKSKTAFPLVLMVFQSKRGWRLLEPIEPNTELEALHMVIRRAYEDVHQYRSPEVILGLARRLKSLERGVMLPQTRLLLALLPGTAREVRASQGMKAIAALHESLTLLTIGSPIHYHNLTIFPLFWPHRAKPRYVLLDRALETGEAVVEQAGQTDGAANVVVANRGNQPVLILHGPALGKQAIPLLLREQLDGGSLLAGAALSTMAVMLAPGVQVAIPAGPFEPGPIDARRGDTPPMPCSETSLSTEHYQRHFPLPAAAAGVLVGLCERIVGLDLFDAPETLQALWDRLSASYFLDGLRHGSPAPPASPALAQQFIERVSGAARPRAMALGLGDELEIAGDGIVGAALLYSGRVCCLSAVGIPR